MNSDTIDQGNGTRLSANQLESLPQPRLDAGREALLEYFHNTWALTEALFSSLLSSEAYYLRPYHRLRHPLIFYYVHPVTFYINKLQVAGLITEPLNAHFETLFETGVDEMAWDDLHEGEAGIWPTLPEVIAYREQVFDAVTDLIRTHPVFAETITMDSPGWALVMCFEHERIHLETSSVLIRELPVRYVVAPECWPPALRRRPADAPFSAPRPGLDFPHNPMLSVPAQTVQAGKPAAWPSFGWDNEYGERRGQVQAFSASSMLISNGEFYEFVRCGAYLEERFWSREGWEWRGFRNTRWPTFWIQDGPVGTHRYRLRTLFAVEAMQWDWPVLVNYYEASAYCAWRTEQEGSSSPYRLLREAEHLALRDPSKLEAARWQPGNPLPAADPVLTAQPSCLNHNLHLGSEGPVDGFRVNSRGFHDVFGNAWQWSQDTFNPLPGFQIHPYYVDFSVPCFDDRHQMMLGGSFISTGDEASIWARFHFRPHFYQHAGFRLVQGDAMPDKYESDAVLDQYLLFHWGSQTEQRDAELLASCNFPDPASEHGLFPLVLPELLMRFSKGRNRVLDLGCAVGRASFELARGFREVIGVDYSHKFVAAARHMQTHGAIDYRRHESGHSFTDLQARLDADIDCSRLRFLTGDAGNLLEGETGTWLQESSAVFDAVLMSNLLCRLPDPARCLQQFTGKHSLLAEDGILVIASPNSWMEQYTQGDAWLDAADNAGTLAKLGALLPGFELLHQQDLPFLIREHRRKYEYIISQVSIWRRSG